MNNPTEISGFIHNVSPLKFPPSPKVSFPPKLIPQKNNIASLSGVHFQNNKTNTIDFINDVQEGETYTCHNLRVIKEYKSDNLALGMTLQDCTLSESEYFPEPVSQPLEVPDSFTTTKIEIKGLTAFGRYLSCLQCHKN
ncbi:hypothetical protein pdam_00024833, partial [Pocillopora damicornis]